MVIVRCTCVWDRATGWACAHLDLMLAKGASGWRPGGPLLWQGMETGCLLIMSLGKSWVGTHCFSPLQLCRQRGSFQEMFVAELGIHGVLAVQAVASLNCRSEQTLPKRVSVRGQYWSLLRPSLRPSGIFLAPQQFNVDSLLQCLRARHCCGVVSVTAVSTEMAVCAQGFSDVGLLLHKWAHCQTNVKAAFQGMD